MARSDIQRLLTTAPGLPDAAGGLKEALAEVAQQLMARSTPDGGAQAQLAMQLEQLRTVSQIQAETVSANTQAVVQNTVAHVTAGGGSTLGGIGKAVWKAMGSGLGLAPLLTGLVRLFGGGEPETPAPLPVYTRPPAIQFEGWVSRSGGPEGWPIAPSESASPRATGSPQITIQVQAMDSRSFMDHSYEIAKAVREAMLNSHSLNDVVNEL